MRKIMKQSSLLMLVVALLYLAGCASVKVHDPRVIIDKGLEKKIQITNVASRINRSELMEIKLEGYNSCFFDKTFQYKVEWRGASGFVIDSVLSKWQKKSVRSKNRFNIQMIAPNKEAMDYRIYIRKHKED